MVFSFLYLRKNHSEHLKILVLCKKVPYPPTDGESLVIMNDLRVFKDLGYKVSLFCLNTKKHWVDTTDYKHLNYWADFQDIEIDTDNISRFLGSFFNSRPLQIARFYERKIDQLLDRILERNKIDFIIYQGLAMTLYQSDSQVKKIYRAHNLEYKIWDNLARRKNWLKRTVYTGIRKALYKYERESLPFLSGIVALSREESEVFKKFYNEKTIESISIPNYNSFKQKYSPECSGLLFIGSLDWQPNREGLDWFLKSIYPAIDHIPLTIAGKGNYTCHLKNVTIIPNFEHTEDLLASHRMMIVPLLSGAGIRIKILEAMQFGLPLISTKIGAEGIDSEEGSYIVADEADQWISSIRKVYADKEELIKLSELSKVSHSKYYSSEVLCAKWQTLLS